MPPSRARGRRAVGAGHGEHRLLGPAEGSSASACHLAQQPPRVGVHLGPEVARRRRSLIVQAAPQAGRRGRARSPPLPLGDAASSRAQSRRESIRGSPSVARASVHSLRARRTAAARSGGRPPRRRQVGAVERRAARTRQPSASMTSSGGGGCRPRQLGAPTARTPGPRRTPGSRQAGNPVAEGSPAAGRAAAGRARPAAAPPGSSAVARWPGAAGQRPVERRAAPRARSQAPTMPMRTERAYRFLHAQAGSVKRRLGSARPRRGRAPSPRSRA